MKILYITQLLPYPADAGGKIKTFSTLSALTKTHDVSVVCFVENDERLRHVRPFKKELRLNFVRAFVNELVVEKALKQQLILMLKSLLTIKPYPVYKYWRSDVNAFIKNNIATSKPDCVWVDHLSMAQYVPTLFNGLTVLENHNVESVLYRRHAEEENKIIWKFFFYIESLKYKWYQKLVMPRFQRVCAISDHDRLLLIKEGVKLKKTPVVLPPAISQKYFDLPMKDDGKTILFTGLLTWYPNKKSIIWFIQDIFPKILQKAPDAKLLVVGDKSKRFPLKNTKNITFTGYVKDVAPYFSKATVFIAPIIFGSGVRIKILEVMAAGIPVVSTSVGAEGLGVAHRKEILVADPAEDFAKSVVVLLQNTRLRRSLVNNAKRFVKKHYTESLVAKQIYTMLNATPNNLYKEMR